MASILYAWELGAGYGHAGTFLPLAKHLTDAGHAVHWAVTSPAQVGSILADAGFRWLQAPHIPEQLRPGAPLSYADILLRFGYANADALFGLVGAWRELIRLTGADLILVDHAPTAVLAARTVDLPVMLFSNGFTVPPAMSPLPNMRPWVKIPAQTFLDLDRPALASVNSVLARHGKPTLPFLASLFDVAEEALLTFPELDHYPNRGDAKYWGSLPSAGTGKAGLWPMGAGARVFAYLRNECPHHIAVLAALKSAGYPTLVFFPNAPESVRHNFASERMHFLSEPADIAQMTREADLAITYASLATTTAFLLAGKPVLMLPFHLEQFLVARRVAAMKAGILIDPEKPPPDLATAIKALAEPSEFRENAKAFASKYAAFDQAQVLSNLVRRIEKLTATHPEDLP